MANSRGISPYVLLGVGVAGVSYLSVRNNRQKVTQAFQGLKEKTMKIWSRQKTEPEIPLLEKAGHPDPYDIPDNRMVDEGALFSVKYYNQKEQQA
ncbi:hypothetical protein [Bacillus sp. V59.32b]|uniref:hypothetical protein n=2 Tax=unclassified Bacillus (in: firmicutes) TaxID=185979 RepID=UPI000E3E3293|nr:hypothetical protein [Bacillus sp. V59.32b]RFU68225.1 hypothetical protein D0463_05565 [Bacillus sp. V59.32b]CAH0347136.1 hypothetical protein BCI9360_03510 [Bacillus sp. CECT 9360]